MLKMRKGTYKFIDFYGNYSDQLKLFFALLSIFFTVGVLIYYIAFPGMKTFHGDDTAALYWAKAGYEAGSLVSPNFWYSYLLPIGSSLLMQIFIPFFGATVTTHILGMTVHLLIYFAVLFCFFRSQDCSYFLTSLFTSITLLLFSSSYTLLDHFWQNAVTYGTFPIFLVFSFALYNKIRNSSNSRIKIYYILIAFSVMLASINGIKVAILVSFPLLFAITAERYFDLDEPLLSQKNISTLLPTILILLSTLVGIFILKIFTKDVLVSSYEFHFSTFSDMADWIKNLVKLPIGWIKLLGVNSNGTQLLYGFFGLTVALRILFGAILICLPLIALFEYRKLSLSIKHLLQIHLFVSLVVFFVWVMGRNSDHERKLIPIFVTATVFCLIYLYEKLSIAKERRIIIPLFAVFLFMAILNFSTIAGMSGSLKDNVYYPVTKELENRGLKYGLGYYWKSQTITAISGFKINVANSIIDSNGVHQYNYQVFNDLSADIAKSDKYFLISDSEELSNLMQSFQWQYISSNIMEQFEINGFTIIVLKGVSDLNINHVVDFNSKLFFINAFNYLSSGWYGQEDWGTWSSNNKAQLRFHLSAGGSRLEFLFNALVTPSHPEQKVIVKLNGDYLKTEVFNQSSGNILTLDLPVDIKENGGVIKIEFELPDTVSPKSLGINNDNRLLAIGLIHMEVK
jgi:hypothetical protein